MSERSPRFSDSDLVEGGFDHNHVQVTGYAAVLARYVELAKKGLFLSPAAQVESSDGHHSDSTGDSQSS